MSKIFDSIKVSEEVKKEVDKDFEKGKVASSYVTVM